jgi:hypothetical protein
LESNARQRRKSCGQGDIRSRPPSVLFAAKNSAPYSNLPGPGQSKFEQVFAWALQQSGEKK